MKQSGPFFVCANRIRWTSKLSLSNQIANFLLYLFQERKLQPSMIEGYRTATADKVGNSTIEGSKDENLTLRLDSFHRDRSKGCRGVPSWNLSLVLHQMNKAPLNF